MKTYAAIADNPDFFIHSGDTIYADGPFAAEIKMPDGDIWKNITTEDTAKVARRSTSSAETINTTCLTRTFASSTG